MNISLAQRSPSKIMARYSDAIRTHRIATAATWISGLVTGIAIGLSA